jgi:ABC-type sugar transport system permease subunit
MVKEIYETMRNRFIIMCVILVALILIIFVSHRSNADSFERASYAITMVCFVSSVICSICIPIIFRLLTFNDVKTNGNIRKRKYLQFKNITMLSVFIGALFALYGYFVLIYDGLLSVSILCSLYGIYSVLPNKKSLNLELIEFNVEDIKNKR